MIPHPEYHRMEWRPGWNPGLHSTRRAETGKFRVVAEDRRHYGDYVVAEYSLLEDAVECAKTHSTADEPHFVYDDQERLLHSPTGMTPFCYNHRGSPCIAAG